MKSWNRHKHVLPWVMALMLGVTMMAISPALAQPRLGPKGAALTPEQAQKIYELRQQFLKETEELRQQLFTKRNELNSLWATENPDEKAIQAKQQEINAIREKIQNIAVSYQVQARKIAPSGTFGWGKGKGMGPWGMW